MILAQALVPWRRNEFTRFWRVVVYRAETILDGPDRGRLRWVFHEAKPWHSSTGPERAKRIARKDRLPGVTWFPHTKIDHNQKVLPWQAARVTGLHASVAMDKMLDDA